MDRREPTISGVLAGIPWQGLSYGYHPWYDVFQWYHPNEGDRIYFEPIEDEV